MEESLAMPVLEASAETRQIIQKAGKATKALAVRQILVYGSNIGGSVLLARMLPPDQYGFYGIILFSVAVLGVFGGTGFAGNLIRLERTPTLNEYRTLFSAQEALVITCCALIWVLAPHLSVVYHLPNSRFFQLLAASLFATSFMVIPQIQMERELHFDKLAQVEVSQALIFNLVAIGFAYKGFGALSFALALLARSITGSVLAFWLSPWRLGCAFDRPALKAHIHYGLALQGSQVVGIVKDSISPLFVGMFLGATEVGYVTWASNLTAYSVWVLMPLQRLYLPLFAKLQADKDSMKSVFGHVLWLVNAVAAPLAVFTIALVQPIAIIGFGKQWLPAIPLFYFLSFCNLFSPSSAPMLGLLNAVGGSKKTLLMSIIWMTSTWAFGVPLTLLGGLTGYGIAMILVQLTNLVLYWMAWRISGANPLRAYWPTWPICAAIGALLFIAGHKGLIHTTIMLMAVGVIALLLYATLMWKPVTTRIQELRQTGA